MITNELDSVIQNKNVLLSTDTVLPQISSQAMGCCSLCAGCNTGVKSFSGNAEIGGLALKRVM